MEKGQPGLHGEALVMQLSCGRIAYCTQAAGFHLEFHKSTALPSRCQICASLQECLGYSDFFYKWFWGIEIAQGVEVLLNSTDDFTSTESI